MRSFNNVSEFRELADRVGELSMPVNVELDYYDSSNLSGELEIVEDDGSLHISCFGLRACFYIGQDVSARDYRSSARRVLREFGVSNSDYEIQGS